MSLAKVPANIRANEREVEQGTMGYFPLLLPAANSHCSAAHEILSQINKYIIFTLEKKTWSVLSQFSASTIDRNKSVLESNLKGNLKPILVI